MKWKLLAYCGGFIVLAGACAIPFAYSNYYQRVDEEFAREVDVEASRVLPGRVVSRVHNGHRFELQLLSREYVLDRVYKSMQGPFSNQPAIRLVEGEPDNTIVWLTGVEARVVGHDGEAPESDEFFCHSNLTLNPETISPEDHNRSFTPATHAEWRFFTLVPGRMSIELPPGFGLPVRNGTRIDYLTMSLNQNPGVPNRKIRMRTRISGRISPQGIRPLFRRALYVYQQHRPTAKPASFDSPGSRHQGELCAEDSRHSQLGQSPSWLAKQKPGAANVHPGRTCCVANASAGGVLNRFGTQNTIHWMVPPGRHVYRSEVTDQMELPFSTTAHYITGHLHPFGTSMRLVDMSSGKTVVEIKCESLDDRLGVKRMSEVTSRKGLRLDPSRRYELIAEYDNPLKIPIDAMAILYVYALDEAPRESAPVAAQRPKASR